ncbi:MAG: phosphoglucomutase/phosphomannomutase family protein, partial [Clostridiales bacterium]|nr:phosphoglucomutase/phosphomannomutase family protein [Clostridiales bacterium]
LYYYLHEHRGWRGPVVRNLTTTHMLDRLAESFGEECHEVPVGFKHISRKIEETNAVLGGESSGGLTVRGHIHGKDSVYAAALLVEALCALRKSPSEMMDELYAKLGPHHTAEESLALSPKERELVETDLMEKRNLPAFPRQIQQISYLDGCKVYFSDGSFVACRFSGTEPLLRLYAEASTMPKAQADVTQFEMYIDTLIRQSRD